MKQINIGISAKGSQDSEERYAIDESIAFPVKIEIENLTPRKLVLPVIECSIAAHSKSVVEIKDKDALMTAITDMVSMAEINKYESAVVLRFQEQKPKKATNSVAAKDPDAKGEPISSKLKDSAISTPPKDSPAKPKPAGKAKPSPNKTKDIK